MNGRHQLDSTDNHVMDKMKEMMSDCILELLERGVRPVNIEIELTHYIKKLLRNE